MTRTLVRDLPTRLFHWLLAGSFLSAFVIANTVDDDGSLFVLHMLFGAVAAFVVLQRLVWGLIGTRPTHVSPAATWTARALFACTLGLAATGVLMSTGNEAVEEVHEWLAWGMMAAVVVHLVGLAVHTVRHREWIALSMVDGRRPSDGVALRSARPVAGLVFLGLTGLFTAGIVGAYDPATSRVDVPLLGAIVVGEGGEHDYEADEHDEHDED